MLRTIIEVATDNIARYITDYNAMPLDAQEVVNGVKDSVYLGFNKSPANVLMIIKDRIKSIFEVYAEKNMMTLSEIAELSHDRQLALISDNGTSDNTQLHKRRVKFSSCFSDGHALTYYSLSMGNTIGNTHYGLCYVVLKLDSVKNATALKYDSLKKYFSSSDDFLEEECFGDLLPYTHIECLVASKFYKKGSADSIESVIEAIDAEVATNDMPLEVMTCELVDARSILSVVMCHTTLDYYMGLEDREERGEVLSELDKKALKIYDELLRTLRKYDIPLKVV